MVGSSIILPVLVYGWQRIVGTGPSLGFTQARELANCPRMVQAAAPGCTPAPENGESMAKPPNYKQDKKRREDAQKKKNQEEQKRKAARKLVPPAT